MADALFETVTRIVSTALNSLPVDRQLAIVGAMLTARCGIEWKDFEAFVEQHRKPMDFRAE